MIQAKSKVNDSIDALEQQLLNVKGRETEKYARIVGYYRAVKNWNKGKKEEYKFRVNYSETSFETKKHNGTVKQQTEVQQQAESTKVKGKIASYMFFFRTTCPNCPPVKAIIKSLNITGDIINADKPEGFTKAAIHEIFTAPTVIFLDESKNEVTRTSDVSELKKITLEQNL